MNDGLVEVIWIVVEPGVRRVAVRSDYIPFLNVFPYYLKVIYYKYKVAISREENMRGYLRTNMPRIFPVRVVFFKRRCVAKIRAYEKLKLPLGRSAGFCRG